MLTPAEVAELKQRIGKRLVVASVSGGKDSAAMSLYLTELGIEHLRVFADTGWEHELTYEYLRGPLQAKIGPVHEVGYPGGMEAIAIKKGMFPSRIHRWCTQELKVFPQRDYMQGLLDNDPRAAAGIVNAVGVRAAESATRAKLAEWEQFPPGFPAEVENWRPLLRWSEQDVIDMHRKHGLPPNPLYLKGASRVGCWPCIFSRKAEIALLSKIDPARIDRMRDMEARAQATAEARYAEKGETFESLGYGRPTFFTQSARNADGKRPCSPIDDVVAWATDAKKDKHLPMFEEPPIDEALEGCMRWGVCETPPPEATP